MNAETHPQVAMLGRTLGDFVVREQLGEGGMGAVYLADQKSLERQVVIKILLENARSDEISVRRFFREAKLASTLDHPFAAHVYDFGAESDGLLWIAMERVRGTPLNALLRRSGAWPVAQWVPFLDRLCEVVQAAHVQGIIHRDLKPANVMVVAHAGRASPKLLDLGVARSLHGGDVVETGSTDTSTSGAERSSVDSAPFRRSQFSPSSEDDATAEVRGEGPHDVEAFPSSLPSVSMSLTNATHMELTHQRSLVGTPAYMAPELWVDSKFASASSDIYALGVMTYEMLTGARPFGGDWKALRLKHLGKVPPAKALSAPVLAVLERALAHEPAARFTSAIDFAQALRQASGLMESVEALPRLDETVHARFLSDGPAPLADVLSALDVATSVDTLGLAVQRAAQTLCAWLGILTLSAQGRVGDPASASRALQTWLSTSGMETASGNTWLTLVREILEPLAQKPDAHPLPELVAFFFPRAQEGQSAVADLAKLADTRAAAEDLNHAVGTLGTVYARASFLCEPALVHARDEHVELWMGLRRRDRLQVETTGDLGEGEVALLDANGALLFSLAPFVQVYPPSPGAPEEVFLFSGRGRLGARLTAPPLGFERHDANLWNALAARGLDVGALATHPAQASRAPYQGLASFTAAEAEHYFGREREAEACANRLRHEALLAIVGPSGVGKSSFVQAGVFPLLPKTWRWLTVRPGPTPLAALEARLKQAGVSSTVRRAPEGLAAELRAATPEGGAFVLVIDQFEELVTLCESDEERRAYVAALMQAAAPGSNVRIVLAFRDDFLIRVKQLEPLGARLTQSLELLATPSPDDLLRILQAPAKLAGVAFEDAGLPAEMVKTVAHQPGALALLSFTALKLWELRDQHLGQLTWKAYRALGGVGGALAQHAESVLASLESTQAPLVKEAFRHLVTSQGTRAVMSRAEMTEVLGATGPAREALEKLIAARLLVTSEGVAGEDRVEVIHEALLSSWPRLVQWQREDAENARLRDQLRAGARQWHEAGRPRGVLWRGDILTEYRLWRGRTSGALTHVEEEFIVASQRADARARRWLRAGIAVVIASLAVGLGVVFHSMQNARQSVVRLFVEQGRQALLQGDPLRALASLVHAERRGARGPALGLMLGQASARLDGLERVFSAGTDSLWGLDLSHDEKRLFVGGADNVGRVFNLADGKLLFRMEGHTDAIVRGGFSPDGRFLVTGGLDKTARLWDATNGRELQVWAHGADVRTVSFTPDSAYVLTSCRDGLARLFSLPDGKPVRTFGTAGLGLSFAAFDPTGHRALTGGVHGLANLWDVGSGKLLVSLKGHTATLRRGTFSHDGKLVLTLSDDKTARVWDSNSGRSLTRFESHAAPPDSFSFSPDDAWVATGSEEGALYVWNAKSGAVRFNVTLDGAPSGLSFSPDGKTLATGTQSGTLKLWDPSSGEALWSYLSQTGGIWNAVFTRDGQHLVTGGLAGSARMWRTGLTTYAHVLHGFEHPGLLNGATDAQVSPDGTRIYGAAQDHSIRVWSRDGTLLERWDAVRATDFDRHRYGFAALSPDGAHLAVSAGKVAQIRSAQTFALERVLPGHTDEIEWVTWSPGGHFIATASRDHRAIVFDAASGAEVWSVESTGLIESASFDAAEQRFATGSTDHVARVYDLPNRTLLRSFSHPNAVDSVELSADGLELLTAAEDKIARVFDLRTGKLSVTLEGHQNRVDRATFSPNGAFIGTCSDDGTVRVWERATGTQLDILGRHSGEVFNCRWSPDGREMLSAGTEGEIRVWSVRSNPPSEAFLAKALACRVPFEVRGEQVVAGPERVACVESH